jgi:hypothetical protein
MADQSQVIKGVTRDLYFCFHRADTGAMITNPAGLAARIVTTAAPTGAAVTAAPTRVDSTGGTCHLNLTASEMNNDYVHVTATTTSESSDPFELTLYPAAAAVPTAALIADAVCDEVITSGHAVVGSLAYMINDIDAEVDLLHSSSAGAGAITWTYTLTQSGGTPIADANVWVSTDAGGSVVVASGVTDQYGVVTFHLDAGTVYVWRAKTGFDFVDPDTEVVS